MEKEKEKKSFQFKFWTLLTVWAIVSVLVIALYITSQIMETDIIKAPTFQVTNNFLALASFIITSFFSFALIKHGDIVDKQNRKNNDAVNARSEAFRTLQFVASNYSAVDFVDYMLIYEVYKRYLDELKKTNNFQFYMREEDVSMDDIRANFNDFTFLSVRIPIITLAGSNAVTSIKFSDFVFHDEEGIHHFVPCGEERNALIIYNKNEQSREARVNLIVRKSSGFYAPDTVNPFLKIRFSHTMNSLLGVSVSGWTELYFVNPHKIEKDGANKYIINSSQFEIAGMPKLAPAVEADIIGHSK